MTAECQVDWYRLVIVIFFYGGFSQTYWVHDFFSCFRVFHFSVPDDFKVNPGAVESIAVHSKDPDKVNTETVCLFNYRKETITDCEIEISFK